MASEKQPADRPAHEQPGEVLTGQDWGEGVDIERDGGTAAGISNAMVGLKKRFFGKGPRKAQTFIHGDFVFCVLEGGLTRSEETLLDAGDEDTVRAYRLKFQATMGHTTCDAVEEITGRQVVGYHSQVVFRPDVGLEFFVLGPAKPS